MPMSTAAASTPYYALLDGKRCFGPIVTATHPGVECDVIYGFSNKRLYDSFCSRSKSTLKPYPLVKGFLRNQVATPDACLRLVVTDAAGPDETYLYAATMKAVLDAQENRLPLVTATYRLIMQPESTAYHVCEAFKRLANEEETAALSPLPTPLAQCHLL